MKKKFFCFFFFWFFNFCELNSIEWIVLGCVDCCYFREDIIALESIIRLSIRFNLNILFIFSVFFFCFIFASVFFCFCFRCALICVRRVCIYFQFGYRWKTNEKIHLFHWVTSQSHSWNPEMRGNIRCSVLMLCIRVRFFASVCAYVYRLWLRECVCVWVSEC